MWLLRARFVMALLVGSTVVGGPVLEAFGLGLHEHRVGRQAPCTGQPSARDLGLGGTLHCELQTVLGRPPVPVPPPDRASIEAGIPEAFTDQFDDVPTPPPRPGRASLVLASEP